MKLFLFEEHEYHMIDQSYDSIRSTDYMEVYPQVSNSTLQQDYLEPISQNVFKSSDYDYSNYSKQIDQTFERTLTQELGIRDKTTDAKRESEIDKYHSLGASSLKIGLKKKIDQ